jgi:SAM-dependent methyltransferase
MKKNLYHIHQRRRALRAIIDVKKHFTFWEESCVPSYCHPNLVAAYISWWRLFKAVELARSTITNSLIDISALDFGSSVGELGHLIPDWKYYYVENDDTAAKLLQAFLPNAVRSELTSLPDACFDVIFALDSLEHNKNYAAILNEIIEKLKPDGILILSGPTENSFYKLGRYLTGFKGHYHETNIFAIEKTAAHLLENICVYSLPFAPSLFRISIWRQRQLFDKLHELDN